MKRCILISALALLWVAGCSKSGKQQTVPVVWPVVTRGPYLQMMSSTAVHVRWRTDRPCRGKVRFTIQGWDKVAQNWGKDQNLAEVTEHEVILDRLLPGNRYAYSVEEFHSPQTVKPQPLLDAAGGMAEGEFQLPPMVGSIQPTRVWVLGDSGMANQDVRAVSAALQNFLKEEASKIAGAGDAEAHAGPAEGSSPSVSHAAEPAGPLHQPDLWLMLGDNAYPQGSDSEYQAAVFDMYPALLRRACLYPAIGNHDAANNEQLTEAKALMDLAYYRNFSLPTKAECGGVPSGTEAYYAFDWGHIHFICLDSQVSDRSATGKMAEWLRKDLAQNASVWTVAFFHHPPYTRGTHDSDKDDDSGGRLKDMRENFLPILEQGGVDLVLCGHSHVYERSFPLAGAYGKSDSLKPEMIKDRGDGDPDHPKPGAAYEKGKGTVYVVAGSSGNPGAGTLDHPVMYYGTREMGSVLLDIDGTQLACRFLDRKGAVLDRFVIEKKPSDVPANKPANKH